MDLTITVEVSFRLGNFTFRGEKFTMTTPVTPGQGLPNAQAALTQLQSQVTTYIADVAQAILNALNGAANPGDSDTAVQALATGMQAVSAQLAAADPITNPVTIPPVPVSPVTPVVGGNERPRP
jgi:hypothetical protein